MQFRWVSAFFIFIGSYLPLAIILAFQDMPRKWWGLSFCDWYKGSATGCTFNPFKTPSFSLTFLALTFFSMVIANLTLRKISYPHEIEIVTAKAIPNDIINYVFPYVVSFMGISYDEPEKLIGFAVFLIWMFVITYKSGQIIMNPLLLLFEWRLYEATILIGENTIEARVLKQGLLVRGKQKAQTIQDFYIARD